MKINKFIDAFNWEPVFIFFCFVGVIVSGVSLF